MRGLELPRLHLGKRHGAEHALGGRCNLLGERSSLPRCAWDVHRGGAPAQSPSSAITFRSRALSSRPFSDEPFSLEERSAWQITCAAALLVRTVHHSHIVPCTMQSRSNYPQSHTGQCTHTAQRRTEPMRFLAFLCPGLTRARYQVWSLAARWAQASTARRGVHCCNRLQLGPRAMHEAKRRFGA